MQWLNVHEDGPVLEIRLARPEALNAVNAMMADEMVEVARLIGGAHNARAILLHGEGRAFMAGGDVAGFQANLQDMTPFLRRVFAGFHGLVTALRSAPQPVVGALHGAVAGGGLSLALACDFLVAGQGTKFSFAYRRLGASPDGGSTYMLPRLVGLRKALELLLLRNMFSAQEALDFGLINLVVEDSLTLAEARLIAARVAQNAPMANASTKALLSASFEQRFDVQLKEEERAFLACAATADFAEGVEAFLTKRAAAFGGPREQ